MSDVDLTRLRIERSDPPSRTRRWVLRFVVLATLAAIVAAALAYWRRHAPLAVETAAVTSAYPSQAYTLLNATGYVVAQRKAAVASKATGRLEWLNVREGSAVRANEVVARLESKDVTAQMEQAAANVKLAQASVEQARAELREAERALARSQELLGRNFVSQASHDAAVGRHERARAALDAQSASVSVAQASLRAAQVAVEQTLIRAPFDGVVLTKNANVGDVITPFSSALGSQAAVVTMADMNTLEVEADVSESAVGKVRPDQPCEIQLDALPDVRFRGNVSRMVPTVDRAKATVTVKIRFQARDERVLPEMSAKVAFLSREMLAQDRSRRTVTPQAAVVERDGRHVVFIVSDDRVVETPVETGERMGDAIELRSGPLPGARVVLRPPEKLRHGAAVTQAAPRR